LLIGRHLDGGLAVRWLRSALLSTTALVGPIADGSVASAADMPVKAPVLQGAAGRGDALDGLLRRLAGWLQLEQFDD
jgi:hypothetical protein